MRDRFQVRVIVSVLDRKKHGFGSIRTSKVGTYNSISETDGTIQRILRDNLEHIEEKLWVESKPPIKK